MAIARPIPVLAPVTIARWPVRSISTIDSQSCGRPQPLGPQTEGTSLNADAVLVSQPQLGSARAAIGVGHPARHRVQKLVGGGLLRKDLVWVEDAVWVEHRLHLSHQLDRDRSVLPFGEVALEGAEAVLGRYRAAKRECVPEDLGRRVADQVPLLVSEEDRGVEIAIARVADGDDAEACLARQLLYAADHLGNLRDRDGDVFGEEILRHGHQNLAIGSARVPELVTFER